MKTFVKSAKSNIEALKNLKNKKSKNETVMTQKLNYHEKIK